jgi:nitrile hydratase
VEVLVPGVSDLGGTPGHGRVPAPDPAEPPFAAGWEARAFALTAFTMGRISGRNLDAFRLTLDGLPAEQYFADGYYGRWLHAAERMLVDSAILAPDAVDSRVRANAGEDVAQPPAPEPAKPDYSATGPGSLREVTAAPAFAPGDRVRPVTGLRLPGYLRGRRGTVEAVRPAHVLPDTHAVFEGEHPQHVYTVAFAAAELWGEGDFTVTAELFESYLERP